MCHFNGLFTHLPTNVPKVYAVNRSLSPFRLGGWGVVCRSGDPYALLVEGVCLSMSLTRTLSWPPQRGSATAQLDLVGLVTSFFSINYVQPLCFLSLCSTPSLFFVVCGGNLLVVTVNFLLQHVNVIMLIFLRNHVIEVLV